MAKTVSSAVYNINYHWGLASLLAPALFGTTSHVSARMIKRHIREQEK